jgi:hypothetical protein
MTDEERVEQIDPRGRRREDTGLPPWAKLAITVISTTVGTMVAMFLWVSSTFVSRVEWTSHATQQALDLARIADVQKIYGEQERETATSLSSINVKLGVIETRQLMVLERLNGKKE